MTRPPTAPLLSLQLGIDWFGRGPTFIAEWFLPGQCPDWAWAGPSVDRAVTWSWSMRLLGLHLEVWA